MQSKQAIPKSAILAVLSQIPVASAFSTFCTEFVNSQWQERIENWQKEVIDKFSKLDEDMELKIKQTSNFANILATAQQNAMKDIEEDKIKFYVASTINSIKNENFDNIKVHIFLNTLSNFTILHIKTLEYFQNPHESHFKPETNQFSIQKSTDRIKIHLRQDCPEIIKNEGLLRIIIKDLYQAQMLKVQSIDDIIISHTIDKQTTYLADEFLYFISLHEVKK